jgi:hypothetical protein
MMAHTNHWKTSSAERNSGQKPKMIERDRHTLRIVPDNHGTTVAQVTAELNIHLEDPVTTKKSDKSFTNSTSSVQLQLLNLLITAIHTKRQ